MDRQKKEQEKEKLKTENTIERKTKIQQEATFAIQALFWDLYSERHFQSVGEGIQLA